MRNEHGIIVMHATVRTNADAILALVHGAGKRVRVAFEEGTQAQWLHDVLQPHAEQVIVCNVRGKNAAENKSDRVDADDLSERLRLGSLKAVYHGAPSVLTLKELVRNYNSLVEDATRVMLRIKALFRALAIATPGTSVYRAARRQEWLDQLTTAGARVRAACLLEQLDLLLKLRPKAKAAMIAEARKQPGWKWLRSIRSSAMCAPRNCGAQDRLDCLTTLEERRALESRKTDDANDIALERTTIPSAGDRVEVQCPIRADGSRVSLRRSVRLAGSLAKALA